MYGLTYYRDADGDGYGDAAADTVACISLAGYVLNSADCDDNMATANPSMNEVCANSIDDNCNNIVDEGCGSGLFQLKVFIEGLCLGNGYMLPGLYNQGLNADPNAADSITVELHNASLPYSTYSSSLVLLLRNGFAVVPSYPAAGNYYIVIRHRNGIETWSKNPVAFTGATVFFDFTK